LTRVALAVTHATVTRETAPIVNNRLNFMSESPKNAPPHHCSDGDESGSGRFTNTIVARRDANRANDPGRSRSPGRNEVKALTKSREDGSRAPSILLIVGSEAPNEFSLLPGNHEHKEKNQPHRYPTQDENVFRDEPDGDQK
jgi:hypothetical protein